MPMLRRKRALLFALLGVVIVGSAATWWAALEKSDFEKQYEQIKVGIMSPEVQILIDSSPFVGRPNFSGMEGDPYVRFIWTDDGEQIILDFKDNRLIGKGFVPLDTRGRLRRLWARCSKSKPPF
jgi:hypothetical protein